MPDKHDATDGADYSASAQHGGPVTIESLTPDSPQFRPAAKHPGRAEGVVAFSFATALIAFVLFGVAYWQNSSSEILGLTIGIGFVMTGVGMVAWGKYLMPPGPFMEERHRMVPTPAERERFVTDFASRGKVAVEGRRKFLAKMFGAAVGVLSIVAAFPLLRSLGPLPGSSLYTTKWRKDSKLVDINGNPVHVDALDVGSALTVFPSDDIGGAQSQTMLIRAATATLPATRPGRGSWGPDGYLAYSKVCTHAGCPVGLYQEETQQLLCPCHQSLFDVLNGAEPVFGPAPRPLPQLPLYVDSHGFLRAQDGYDEPIGPGFWERGND
jgi:ubiquinol-cytochrome c reductase iron-sulfur subunit